MGHLRIKPSTGQFLKSADGHLIKGCPRAFARWELIPCELDNSGCEFCTGDTPRWIKVVFSGLEICGGCFNDATPTSTFKSADSFSFSGVNGTFFLDSQIRDGPCRWHKIDFGAFSYTEYKNLNCTGDTRVITGSLEIQLIFSNFGWSIGFRGWPPASIQSRATVFVGDALHPPAFTCRDPLVIANQDICGYHSFDTDMCQTGSVAITPIASAPAAERCPGGGSLYTSSDLSAVEGKIIFWGDPGEEICWTVVRNTTTNSPDTNVEGYSTYDECGECCDG